ncbi:MAG: bis(5'-nucleosyl)-tetraphosphatase (symmetrical) YqeK [Acutalibacteraceae bacterium]|nr:bis(5'-nucleosyl)-tetraphosphatase (symmetrical) YqeK [Acutalibacteraceae bacterium]
MTFDEYKNIIKVKMGKKRYTHSINVAKAAQQLAIRYGGNIEKAMIAGILHDITKEMPFDQQLQIIESNGIILNNVQSFSPKTWHAISGSVVIEKEIGIADEDILNAVKYHTSGRANMSLLEKIIFVADFIGEERDYKGVDVMRSKAKKSLEEAMLYGVTFTIRDLAERQCAIDMNTLALYNELIINKNRK